jgi:hypothetical protein
MASTTSGLYISRRGSFHYVVSWEFSGPNLKWTAVVRDASDSSKLLAGEMQPGHPEVSLGALVRRQVEERIDRAGWLE